MRLLLTILLMSTTCFAQEFEGNFIEVTTSGGTGPYTYSIDNAAYQVEDIFFEVVPGVHTIRIKDSLACVKISTCMLYSDVSMKISVWNGMRYVPIEQYIPSPNNFLSIQLQGIGGKPPYLYSRNSTTNYINKVFWNGLSKNTPYTFRVKDALNYIYYIKITL